MTSIAELKQRKRDFKRKTLSETYLRDTLGLKESEIKKLKSVSDYGKKRYDLDYICDYMGFKKNFKDKT